MDFIEILLKYYRYYDKNKIKRFHFTKYNKMNRIICKYKSIPEKEI